nr:unnamed protein product [Digitaria exilis]
MHRGGDRSGGPSGGGDRSGGRFQRGPARWSGGGGGGGAGSPPHRYSRGGGDSGGGGGGRFHPYRGSSDYSSCGGGGGAYRGGGSGDDFGEQRHRYGGGNRGGGRGDFQEVACGGSELRALEAPVAVGEAKTQTLSNIDVALGIFVQIMIVEVIMSNFLLGLFQGQQLKKISAQKKLDASNLSFSKVRPLFEEHGDVLEIALIKDRKTGEQQGCCFVKYATSEEADRAIRGLHNQYTLPGAMGPVQVRYADGERERHGNALIFAPYGHVEDVYIMRDGMRQSRGCGFVKFSSKEPAVAAMNALNGTYIMRGCEQPLVIRFADPKRPRPGESRGGPAFGGPGFSPRSDAALVIRPTANLDEPRGRHMPPDSWRPSSPRSMAPNQYNNFGSDNPLALSGGAVTSSDAAAFRPQMFPGNGSLSTQTAVPTSSHMEINYSQLQTAGSIDTDRIQQGIQAAQERAWKS